MIGAATVAAIVVTLTAARTLAEVLGAKHKLEDEPREAPWFYGSYAVALIACAAIVASGVNLISLSIGVQVMNALLLPIVLGFLYLLARRLPAPYRLQGPYALVCGAIILVTVVFGVDSGVAGCGGDGDKAWREAFAPGPSWPGLTRPPTRTLPAGRNTPTSKSESNDSQSSRRRRVDGRVKPGHDEEGGSCQDQQRTR